MSTAAAFDLKIANSALTKVGAPSISSLSENSTEARVIAPNVPIARDFVLQGHGWYFMKDRAKLTPDPSAAPAFGHTYAHPLPSNFAHLDQLLDANESVVTNFSIEGEHLLSDEDVLHLYYHRTDFDVNRIPATVQETIAYYLAYSVSYKLNPQERPNLMQAYLQALRSSRHTEHKNRPPMWYAKGASKHLSRFS